MTVEIPDAAAMIRAGVALAPHLRAGDLVILDGPLGAGKTTLARGVGQGLGVRGAVTSPTFVLARVHPPLDGRTPLVHVDAYRLETLDEMEALDLDVSLDDSITLVEWGQGKVEGLAAHHLLVRIERPLGTGSDPQPDEQALRTLTLTGTAPRWQAQALHAMEEALREATGVPEKSSLSPPGN